MSSYRDSFGSADILDDDPNGTAYDRQQEADEQSRFPERYKVNTERRFITKPTKTDILRDFRKWTSRGSDSIFQFNRAVRRWIACGYEAQEIPLLFDCTLEQLEAALGARQ
jgi:hypothetical protein